MRFRSTSLSGAYLIESDAAVDDRGYFLRAYAAESWEEAGIDPTVVHINLSGNTRPGTVRGLHYQVQPWAETKTVRCVQGRVWDVIVDLRPESESYLRWEGFELSLGNAIHIPPGFAHGFQTLEPDSTVLYLMGNVYQPDASRGIRYDDPALGIRWPLSVSAISDRDMSYRPIGPQWSPGA